MKATGIVRRIDDLGRVVVPKEIRRTLRIREGDPLEIFADRDGQVMLKKYSPIGELVYFAEDYVESLTQVTGYTVCVTDREHVVAVAGNGRKQLQEAVITEQLFSFLEERQERIAQKTDAKFLKIVDGQSEQFAQEAIVPILCEGDVVGAVCLLAKEEKKSFGITEQLLARTAASFLGRQMEQ